MQRVEKLTADQAKKLASRLAHEVEKGTNDTPRFQRELAQHQHYQEEQAAAGKATRQGKHGALTNTIRSAQVASSGLRTARTVRPAAPKRISLARPVATVAKEPTAPEH
jgi:hypothetical protein